jgi:hypothetical protein
MTKKPQARGRRRVTHYRGFMQSSAAFLRTAATLLIMSAVPIGAHAVDGCQVLLCMAGNWKSIPLCVSPVRQVLKDLARGKPFPTCSMGDAGGSANHQWATQANCPPMYSQYHMDSGAWVGCRYAGVISVKVDGAPWADVFWSRQGSTSTRHHAAAREALAGQLDTTYDDDLRAWRPQFEPAQDRSGGY